MDPKIEKKAFLERLRGYVFNRQRAYRTTFNKDSLTDQVVLKDLARFCRANETCFHEDPRLHALIEGRREVWLRIQSHLILDSESLFKLTEGKTML